jgi:uncharacterized protein with HEPN domain
VGIGLALPPVRANQKRITMRNIVIHEYHGVNLGIIWQTVKEDLPPLVAPLKRILQEE